MTLSLFLQLQVVVDLNKRVFSWGFGGYGRLGHSGPKDEMVPRNLKCFDMAKRGASSVYAGGSYSMAIGESGRTILISLFKFLHASGVLIALHAQKLNAILQPILVSQMIGLAAR